MTRKRRMTPQDTVKANFPAYRTPPFPENNRWLRLIQFVRENYGKLIILLLAIFWGVIWRRSGQQINRNSLLRVSLDNSVLRGPSECEDLLLYKANPTNYSYLGSYQTILLGSKHRKANKQRIARCAEALLNKNDTVLIENEYAGNGGMCNTYVNQHLVKNKLYCRGWDIPETSSFNKEMSEFLAIKNMISLYYKNQENFIKNYLPEIAKLKDGIDFQLKMKSDVEMTPKEREIFQDFMLGQTASYILNRLKNHENIENIFLDLAQKWESFSKAFPDKLDQFFVQRNAELSNQIKKYAKQGQKLAAIAGTNHLVFHQKQDPVRDPGVELLYKELDQYADANPYAVLLDVDAEEHLDLKESLDIRISKK